MPLRRALCFAFILLVSASCAPVGNQRYKSYEEQSFDEAKADLNQNFLVPYSFFLCRDSFSIALKNCNYVKPKSIKAVSVEQNKWGSIEYGIITSDGEKGYISHEDLNSAKLETKHINESLDISNLPPVQLGCLGRPAFDCAISIEHFINNRDGVEDIKKQIKDDGRIDVNGKPVATGYMITIYGTVRGKNTHALAIINYEDKNKVDSVHILLPDDPLFARTEEDYDETGVYEAAKVVLGTDCPNLERLEFYRFIENTVKKQEKFRGRQKNKTDVSRIISYDSDVMDIPYCGHKLSFYKSIGYDSDNRSRKNKHGSFSTYGITFR